MISFSFHNLRNRSIARLLAIMDSHAESFPFCGSNFSGCSHKYMNTSATHSSISQTDDVLINMLAAIFHSSFEYLLMTYSSVFSFLFWISEIIFYLPWWMPPVFWLVIHSTKYIRKNTYHFWLAFVIPASPHGQAVFAANFFRLPLSDFHTITCLLKWAKLLYSRCGWRTNLFCISQFFAASWSARCLPA